MKLLLRDPRSHFSLRKATKIADHCLACEVLYSTGQPLNQSNHSYYLTLSLGRQSKSQRVFGAFLDVTTRSRVILKNTPYT